MSRATIVLIVLVLVVVALLVWLSRSPADVAPHRIEKVVTLNGSADADK